MMYYDFEAGNKVYKLRLSTRSVVALENKLGCNPIAIFGKGDTIPTITTMVTILHAALQQFQHGTSQEDAYNIYDEYINDGHTMTDFIPVIVEVFKMSGIIPKDSGEGEEKN